MVDGTGPGLKDFLGKLRAEAESRAADDRRMIVEAAAAEVRGEPAGVKVDKLANALERQKMTVEDFEKMVAAGRVGVATAEQLRAEQAWSSWWQSEYPEKTKVRDEIRAKLQTVEAEIATCAFRVGSGVMGQLMRAVNTFRADHADLAKLLLDEKEGRSS